MPSPIPSPHQGQPKDVSNSTLCLPSQAPCWALGMSAPPSCKLFYALRTVRGDRQASRNSQDSPLRSSSTTAVGRSIIPFPIFQVRYTEDGGQQRGKGSFPAMITPAYQIAKRAAELASDVSVCACVALLRRKQEVNLVRDVQPPVCFYIFVRAKKSLFIIVVNHIFHVTVTCFFCL